MAKLEPILSSRRDLGLIKVAKYIADVLGAKSTHDLVRRLMPIPLPIEEFSDEEIFAAMGEVAKEE